MTRSASFITQWILIITILYFITSLVMIEGQKVPCGFFFGDSYIDNGNNNFLRTVAKANYKPYGIDYLCGPTGRFNNGRTIADFIAGFLGFPQPIPAFIDARGPEIIQGLNYASGGAGILDVTGENLGSRFTMNQQLQNHRITIKKIIRRFGGSNIRANDYLQRCLYTIYIGSNDYVNNYLLPQFYQSSRLYTPDQFAEILIQQYTNQLKELYEYGARKVAIFGVGKIGCLPGELRRFPSNGSICVDFINDIVRPFDESLKKLVEKLNNNLSGAKFTYINTTSVSSGNPSDVGIRVVNAPCCEVASTGLCIPKQIPCSNRSEYAFFDDYHFTEIVNGEIAQKAYTAASTTDAYPVDIQHLVHQSIYRKK